MTTTTQAAYTTRAAETAASLASLAPIFDALGPPRTAAASRLHLSMPPAPPAPPHCGNATLYALDDMMEIALHVPVGQRVEGDDSPDYTILAGYLGNLVMSGPDVEAAVPDLHTRVVEAWRGGDLLA